MQVLAELTEKEQAILKRDVSEQDVVNMVWKLGMFAIQQECLRQRGTQAAGHRNANSRLQK